MNKVVLEKLKGYSKAEIDLALKCLDLDEMTLLEANNYDDSITEALNFIADKMVEFLKFREYVLSKNPLFGYFKDLCPFQMRFNNTLKKLSNEDLELINSLFKSETKISEEDIVKAFNKVVPQINYDLIVFTSHSEPLFISYFKDYRLSYIPVALSNLNNRELDLIYKGFGSNLDQIISSKNTTPEERKIIFNEILPKITKYLTNLEIPTYKFNLSGVLKELKNIGIETIALELPEEYRNFIFKNFNKVFNSYKGILDFSKSEYDFLTQKLIPLIKSYAYSKNVGVDYSSFLNFWNGRSLEELAPYLIRVNKKDFEFLIELYGKNLAKILNLNLDDKQKNRLKRVVEDIKKEIENNPDQKDIIKVWEEIKKENSTNILKLACRKVNVVYKNILDKFYGEDLKNILTPSVEGLTIDELWKLYNTIFKEIKEGIKLFGSRQVDNDLKETNKYFIDGVFKDYSIVALLSAVAKLPVKDIGCLKDMYGMNLNRPLLILDKSKFNDLIYDIFPQLMMILDSKEFKKELTNDMYLLNLYPDDKDLIIKIIENLKEEDQLIVKKLYGENLDQRLSFNQDELSNQDFLSFRIRIIEKIKMAINNYIHTGKFNSFKSVVEQNSNEKNKNSNISSSSNESNNSKVLYFYKIFGEENEVKEKVNNLLTQIPDEYIILLKKLYGENLQNPIQQKNVSLGEYSKFYGSLLPKLKAMFNGINVNFNIQKLRNNLYNYFSIDDSLKENVLEIINTLEEGHKNIIFKIYGENLDMFFGTMRVNSEELQLFYNIIIPNIQIKLRENNLVLTRKKRTKCATSYGNLLQIFGEGKEQEVKEAIDKLPEKYQLQLKVLYGENYDQELMFSKKEYNNFNQTIFPKLKKLINGEEVTFGKENKYKRFYKIFEDNEETKKKVKEIVDKLSEEQQIILKALYGENLEEELNYSKKEYESFIRTILPKINKYLNMDDTLIQDNNDLKTKDKRTRKYQYFFKIFGEEPTVKEEILETLKKVPDDKIIILQKMYGENFDQEQNRSNITDSEYTAFIKLVSKIKDIRSGQDVKFQKQRDYSTFFEIFSQNTEDKEKQKEAVKEAVKKLPDNYKKILISLYGEDLENELDYYAIPKVSYNTFNSQNRKNIKWRYNRNKVY